MTFHEDHPHLSIVGDFVSKIGSKVTTLFGKDDKEEATVSIHEKDACIVDPLLDEEDQCDDCSVEVIRQDYEVIRPATQFKCGPVLRFQDILVEKRRWIGSCLIVTDKEGLPPRLIIRDPTKARVGFSHPRHLESWEGNHFFRYDIHLRLMSHREKMIEYWFETENGERVDEPQKWNFYLPALDEGYNWAFYSCNGFTSDVEDPEKNFNGANPLWDDLLATHDKKPFHAMVGGGDQIYNDDVLATPEMVEWLKMDGDMRIATEFNNEKKYAVEKYYFEHYIQHYTIGTYSKALSVIPSVNTWDDHDILDGYGSYPERYQLCEVMQGIGAAASRFYLLFQQHTNASSTQQAGLLTSKSGKGWSCISHFGKNTLVVLPDTRSERSKEMILSDETYYLMEEEIKARLLPTTKHLVIVLGTPLVYPALKLFEEALEKMGDKLSRGSVIGKIFGKCKAFENVLGQFGPELLDDLVDSWACTVHTEEKKRLVEMLQQIAVQRSIRVTFVGGDVHVGGAGRLFGSASQDRLSDPYDMVQIVSSAIVNGPPPGAVITALHKTSKTYKLNEYTSEEMTEIFQQDVDGSPLENKKLLNRRNWCEVREKRAEEQLKFSLHVENLDHIGAQKYRLFVDSLRVNEE
ncbi:hypothetical protein BX616_002756 [Lobosporangium transversale]|uniref:PhoD-like phosphatase domain-containing protein n=1 Tax=Lobosporangium transversale TaxID=64571 RepID=A0A1Y2H4H9_9FUNG|nr:hypothetical protein BCR41DRAFT_344294 [Lobosporangium transversale]KAF9899970.1 hypothetical protein BX616_002756 [Lobosporangium transversale]ORZ28924.1 hypothetical protein BCR41DRAFT_344294 [Lobosporangium transversale]|eukprot:XP_021886597.1 hypothetical protein BCR41DRAFT_344294 [Lobosporangium transversale]